MRVIDLFAGAGGSSEGARQAGADVVWAANHWALAVEVHARNHPETAHACQDLHQFDWSQLRDLGADVVLASPACQGHSRAASAGGRRGSLGKHDADRSTAWAVVSCLEATRAPVCVVENVVELRDWALYPSWCDALARLGYVAHEHVIDAAGFGVPQQRARLFVTLVRRSSPLILWPSGRPRIAPRASLAVRDPDAQGWKNIAELPDGARSRIERAAARLSDCTSFSVNYTTDDVGRSIADPLSTITTKHQRAWVRRTATGRLERRMFTSREYARAMGFPDSYQLTGHVSKDCKLVGNAVCPPVMRAIVTEIRRRG